MKRGFSLEFEPYNHRDPVSGTVKTFIRDKHAHQSSERLIRHKRCVRERMEGFRPSGATPRERSASIRAALAAASRACSGGR